MTGLGITGFQAADWLYEHRRIGAELHDMHHVMFLVTIADDEHAIDELVAGMRALADAAPEIGADRDIPSLPLVEQLVGEYVMPPRAFVGTTRRVKLQDAAGEIAAEPVSPTHPVCHPRPRSAHPIRAHRVPRDRTRAAGMFVEGVSDPSLDELRVVA